MKLAIQADWNDPQEYRRPLPGAYLETCDWWDHRVRPWPDEQEWLNEGEDHRAAVQHPGVCRRFRGRTFAGPNRHWFIDVADLDALHKLIIDLHPSELDVAWDLDPDGAILRLRFGEAIEK